jgi:hypothetical protein
MKIASGPFLTLLVWSDPVINNRFCRPVRLDVTAGRFDSHPTGLAPAEFAGFPAILDILATGKSPAGPLETSAATEVVNSRYVCAPIPN